MRREQLEHAIRAATEIVQQERVIIIGSQAVLGTWHESDLPERAVESIEVDICPMRDDDAETLADLLDGVAGEYSPFHQTHGFYVQGVGRRTAVLPPGWEERLVEIRNETPAVGLGCASTLTTCVPRNSSLTARRTASSY